MRTTGTLLCLACLCALFGPGMASLEAGAQLSQIAPRLSMSDALMLPRGEPVYQRGASVACGGSVFLVVWQEGYHGLGGDCNILGLRLDRNGNPLDESPIRICVDLAIQESPAVAFCDGKFLVVWTDFRNGNDYDIYATLVDSKGKVAAPNGVLVSGAGGSQINPAVASNGKDSFFVVWQDRRGASFDMYGARVFAAGEVLDKDGLLLTTAGGMPALAFGAGQYFVSLGNSGFLVGPDGKVSLEKPELWSDRTRSPGAALFAWGKFLAMFNTSPHPSPWGWASNGAIIGLSLTPEGDSPEMGATKHGWYDLAGNQADRQVRNVIEAARWRNHNGWPMGMPGGFKGSHDGVWPAGRLTAAWNGRSMIVVWMGARFTGKHDLGIRDLYLKRVLDNWSYVDEPRLKIVSGETDQALPELAADFDGNAILAYERQQTEGGVALEFRVIREEEDTEPPRILYVAPKSRGQMIVAFDEPVDPESVSKPGNFAIKGLKVRSASFREYTPALMRQVLLETEDQEPEKSCVLTVRGVRDLSPRRNAVAEQAFPYLVKPGVAQDSDFVEQWCVAGPFPANWKVNFVDPGKERPSPGDQARTRSADELKTILKQVVAEDEWKKDGWDDKCEKQFRGPKEWRAVKSVSACVLNLAKTYGELDIACAYAHTYVYSDRDRDVLLRVDSNDGNRAWLNGELVSSDPEASGRGFHDYTNETESKLKKGWNRLLLQVENKFGHWAVVAQLTDRNRQPIRDLTYQLENPFGRVNASSAQ